MPDRTRVHDGWAVGPGDDTSHFIVSDQPVCDSVQREIWYESDWEHSRCMLCEKKQTDQA